MRPVQVAAFLLTPFLATSLAFAGSPKTDPVADTQSLRVSTGIVAPVMLYPEDLRLPAGSLAAVPGGEARIVLSLNVDEKGNAQNVRVVESAGPELDSRIVTAVLQSHFRPATLNKHAIPVDMALIVKVQRY